MTVDKNIGICTFSGMFYKSRLSSVDLLCTWILFY